MKSANRPPLPLAVGRVLARALFFLPALDGIRPQWREATESLGGNTWHYWRRVAGPLLLPAFLGSALLLFANAFSAYATAAALISQGGIIVPLQISNALTSEVGLAQANLAKAMALAMVVLVTLVMGLYALFQQLEDAFRSHLDQVIQQLEPGR